MLVDDRGAGTLALPELLVASGGAPVVGVAPADLLGRTPTRYERWCKPALDRAAALLLLLVLLPALLVIAVTVRASLGPGVLYRQQRVGRDGRRFDILKFRTMAQDRRRTQLPFDGVDRRSTHKTLADPRHTAVGRFLRRYSLDELPQLWNVVRGDLSLVGPRPELVEIVEARYGPRDHARHLVRPGLTGLWQVTERGDGTQMHQHVDTDLRYVAELSWRLDVWILAQTLPAVLGGNRGE